MNIIIIFQRIVIGMICLIHRFVESILGLDYLKINYYNYKKNQLDCQ